MATFTVRLSYWFVVCCGKSYVRCVFVCQDFAQVLKRPFFSCFFFFFFCFFFCSPFSTDSTALFVAIVVALILFYFTAQFSGEAQSFPTSNIQYTIHQKQNSIHNHTHTHTQTHTHIHTHMHTDRNTHTRARAHAHTHTHTHTRAHTHTHTHTRTNTHTARNQADTTGRAVSYTSGGQKVILRCLPVLLSLRPQDG